MYLFGSSLHDIFEVRQAKPVANVSVCPVMETRERNPQLVGTGGTTFDYLQQPLERNNLHPFIYIS